MAAKPLRRARLGRAFAVLAVLLVVVAVVLAVVVLPAQASTVPPGARALNWAEANAAGHWYGWGGTGPSYDCSGLVYESVGRADGIWLPRTTYAMTGSWHLYRIPLSQARRGDLLFWFGSGGAYHVEFATAYSWLSFGAQHSGTRVWWHQIWDFPTAYRLR